MRCVSVALVTGQARRMRRIILSAVACTTVPHFSHYIVKTRFKVFWKYNLNICTDILHCIYRKFKTNSSNKINFTDIPLYFIPYFILQQQFYEDIIKLYINDVILIISSKFIICLFFILMANDFLSLWVFCSEFQDTMSVQYTVYRYSQM